jgi:hypothetical protein
MALFGGRTVLVTVTKVDDKTIRASVIPALAKTDENTALSPRITFTGPPNGLGAEPARHLAGYPQAHKQTASTLADARAVMAAAVPSPITIFAICAANPRLQWDAVQERQRRPLPQAVRHLRRICCCSADAN